MLPEYIKYYDEILSPEKRKIYRTLYKGFRDYAKEIVLECDNTVITTDDIGKIMHFVYDDTPSFYYIKLSLITTRKISNGYLFFPHYIYTPDEIRTFDRELIEGVQLFSKLYIKPGMSDYEKELVIHDYLVTHLVYDHETLADPDGEEKHPEIYTVLGALLRRKAVCWGMAGAVKFICDYLKIKCIVVTGEGLSKKGSGPHAWNIIQLDGVPYQIDITWDLRDKENICCIYENFNLDDSLISVNHRWDLSIYPRCSSIELNYFRLNGYYVKRLDQVKDYVLERLRKGERYLLFKFVAEIDDIQKIKEEIKKAIHESEIYNTVFWTLCSEVTHNFYIEAREKTEEVKAKLFNCSKGAIET